MCDGDRSASASGLEEWLQWEAVLADCVTGLGVLEHRTAHEHHKVHHKVGGGRICITDHATMQKPSLGACQLGW